MDFIQLYCNELLSICVIGFNNLILPYNLKMAEIDSEEFKNNIKVFEQKVFNRSVGELLILDPLADKLLECISPTAKPNTLSLLSFFPLAILALFVTPNSSLSFLFTFLVFLIHQILDVANKKQAYRLGQFSLSTFYIDHYYDSLSQGTIAFIISKLLLGNENCCIWICVFVFGMLPFYIAHLSMYNTGYMEFQLLAPSIEGLFIFQLLFLIAIPFPNLFQDTLFGNFQVYHLIGLIATVWLITFIGMRIYKILTTSKEQLPLKNGFVIFVFGYVFFEVMVIQPELLANQTLFGFMLALNLILFSLTIGNLILAYGSGMKYNQLSLNTLIVTTGIIGITSIQFLAQFDGQTEIILGTISIGTMCVLQAIYGIWQHRKILRIINQAVSQ